MKRTKGRDIPVRDRQGKRDFPHVRIRRGFIVLVLLATLFPAGFAQVGTSFAELRVKGAVFRDAKVLSVSATSLTVKHTGGLAQIPLRDLTPELQAQFGFEPARAAAAEEALAAESAKRAPGPAAVSGAPLAPPSSGDSPVDRAFAKFGSPAEWRRADLRPRMQALELVSKDQGRRPSCAVFAVVSALEYQNAELVGRAEKLSEEYLIWATRQTIGLKANERRLAEGTEDTDAGFTLTEVVSALRSFGIPLQAEMPNAVGLGMEKIAPPAANVVQSARVRRQVFAHVLPGRDNEVKVANIVHVLDEGVPVVIGLRWPHWRTLRAPFLSKQTPVDGFYHAVTLVGYYTDDGTEEGVRFVFKNSWGASWGNGGYGLVDLGYLRRNLTDGVILEVRASAPVH